MTVSKTLLVLALVPLFLAGAALAEVLPEAPGDPAWCAKHPGHWKCVTTTTSPPTTATAPTTTAPSTTTAPPAPPPPSGIVKSAQFHCMWGAYTDALRVDTLDKLKAAGVAAVRIDMAWAGFQPTGPLGLDAWYTALADRCIDFASARGFTVLVTLWWTPTWAGRADCAGDRMCPPADPVTYENISRTLAARWAAKVQHFQVWNEPTVRQGWKGTVADYVRVLCAGNRGFKAGNPGSTVSIDPALTVGIGTDGNDSTYLREAYLAGAKDCMDIVSVHPYQAGDWTTGPDYCPTTDRWWFCGFERFLAVMQEFGDGAKPVWFTELGWSTGANPPAYGGSVSEAQQAEYARRAVEIARSRWPNVQMISWYKDRALGASSEWLDGFALIRPDGSVKPALAAFGAA